MRRQTFLSTCCVSRKLFSANQPGPSVPPTKRKQQNRAGRHAGSAGAGPTAGRDTCLCMNLPHYPAAASVPFAAPDVSPRRPCAGIRQVSRCGMHRQQVFCPGRPPPFASAGDGRLRCPQKSLTCLEGHSKMKLYHKGSSFSVRRERQCLSVQ